MITYRVSIPPHVAEMMVHLPPAVKQDAKQAFRILSRHPHAGDPLGQELEGLWKFRIRSFRIVYRIVTDQRMIQIIAVDPRPTVYDFVRRYLASGVQ